MLVEVFFKKTNILAVRPISCDEESRWIELVSRHHYLGFNGLIGEQIKYVAVLDGSWVGLLGWASSAYKCADRDAWIGWKDFRSTPNLKFIANNWRFLILPEVKIKNLASKILSENLKRLSQDWQAKYGHPVLLAETFVDEARFSGACYKAAGWLLVGKTAGFEKGHDGYSFHGKTKLIFIKPLTQDVKMKLKGSHGIAAPIDIEQIPILGPDGFLEFARSITDHRGKHGRRFRADGFLVLCLLAMMSGAKSYVDIHRWIKAVPSWILDRTRIAKAPCVAQVRRFLMGFDTDELETKLTQWLLEHVDLAGKQIAFDGKTIRGSRSDNKRAMQLVSAMTTDKGIIIAQKRVPESTNEIPVTREMMKDLPLKGSTVSADAAHSQIETVSLAAKESRGGIFIFKGNQKAVKDEIKSALQDRAFSPSAQGLSNN